MGKNFTAATLLTAALMSFATVFGADPPSNISGIEGVISVSPAQPGPAHVGVENSTGLANTEFVATDEKGAAKVFTTNDQGKFRVALPAGHYIIALKQRGPRIGRFGPFEADVSAGKMTSVSWRCDSGMR